MLSETKQKGEISGAHIVDDYGDCRKHSSLHFWLNHTMDAKNDLPLNELLFSRPSPFVVVLDQFDDFLAQMAGQENLLCAFTCSLAQNSLKSRKYVVIILCKNHESVRTVLGWNGMDKIRLQAKPDECKMDGESLEQLLDLLSPPGTLDSSAKEFVLEQARTACAPGFLTHALPVKKFDDKEKNELRQVALGYCKAWEKVSAGIKELP